MRFRWIAVLLVSLTVLLGLQAQEESPAYLNADLSIEERVTDLLGRMSLDEKIGQTTLIEKNSITPAAVTEFYIGGLLSGGGGYPRPNTPEAWAEMVASYQTAALATPLEIPMIYGVDAVHGHSNMAGAVIFPHNVGLGATRNPELVREIARITALEMIATGIYWNYAPVLAVPQDIRWGRAYEGYSENTALVTELATAYLQGLQGESLAAGDTVLGTPKHYIGDGGTAFGTSPLSDGLLDRGETQVDEATLRELYLPPYEAAIANGARNIMISYSSWNGLRMHGQDYLINDVLRGELGFTGFIVSDWAGMDDVSRNYYDAIVASFNAGIDMNMVPYDYARYIRTMQEAVENGAISMERLDEAVSNILMVKFEMGLFERPYGDAALLEAVGSEAHRELARDAVSQTLVLLKNENAALPLVADTEQTIFIAGEAADSIGIQSGGWTIEWQGSTQDLTEGTSIRTALETAFNSENVHFNRFGRFDRVLDSAGNQRRADVGIVVIGERPYAEFFGDSETLALSEADMSTVTRMREVSDKLVVILLSGRPMVIDTQLNQADAFVAAWLPGTEGAGVTDVLFGTKPFVGQLSFTWLRNIEQLPFDFANLPSEGCEAPLFPYGYGLTYESNADSAAWLELASTCAPVIEAAAPTPSIPAVALPDPNGESLVATEGLLPPVAGEVTYIPYPVAITLDGNLSDWNGIPFDTVTKGIMTSPYPEENGSFQFALASDTENLYLYMVMPDATIVTGQHGSDFWNEDSLELYVNFTDDPYRNDYADGAFQVNINPGNMGNTDPKALVMTGVNATSSNISAFVFPIQDGWGFEAAIPLPDSLSLSHGLPIGFQAHANGSAGGDRDVKLIWSNADTNDSSWQSPSVFGLGVFYEVGNTDLPELPSRPVALEGTTASQAVSVNQLGYLVDAPHFGMLANQGNFSTAWALIDEATGEMVYASFTGKPIEDSASGDTLHLADFSDFKTAGTYRLMIFGTTSAPFTIGNDIYAPLMLDAARYFYLNRSGIELLPEFAGEDYARQAGHLTDNNVTCYRGTDLEGVTWEGCDYVLNAAGGWYDAGDYGKYVVNGGISLWTLLNLYERFPEIYADASLNIPESGNGVSDLLDEARWEMEWMLAMQVPQGHPQAGMVHHKLHDLEWEGMPTLPPTEFNNNNEFAVGNGRYLFPPSTAATYNMAATAAQCARIWREMDADFADRCLTAATTAFDAAQSNPIALAGNTPGAGGGNYDDKTITDELFWAAAELYITTNDAQYLEAMRSTPHLAAFAGLGKNGAMTWGDTGALGALSLILHHVDLPEIADLRSQILATADTYLATIASEGYRLPITSYDWGSNSAVLNNAIVLGYAYDLTSDSKYLYGMTDSMDYLLGRNALAMSFISGYGQNAMSHPHHRVWANEPENGYPAPPAGVVAGGPNAEPSDPTALELAQLDAGPARRYVDAIGSWSTNEVTINWNAPLVWVTSFINTQVNSD